MSKLAPLPKWPAGRKHISVKEVAELAAHWRYGPCADPPPLLAIDMSQCDFETMAQIYAMDHQARENQKSICRRRVVEIVTFEREILALASQLAVRLRRPTIDTPAFCEPDENFVLDEEGFRKIRGELLDPLGISDNSPDAPESIDQSKVSESAVLTRTPKQAPEIARARKVIGLDPLVDFFKMRGHESEAASWEAAKAEFPDHNIPRDSRVRPAIKKAFPHTPPLTGGRPKNLAN